MELMHPEIIKFVKGFLYLDKIQIIENLLVYIFPFSFLLPVLAYLLVFKRVKLDAVCAILVIYGLVFFSLNFFYEDIPREYRKAYYFSYTFLEFISFASILFLRTESRRFKQVMVALSILFVLFQILYYFYGTQQVLDSVPIGISTILIFIFVVNYFLQEFRSTKEQFIYSNYIFWISVGIMFYLGLTFFFNILANHIKDSNVTKYWELTYIFDFVKNIIFAYAIISGSRQVKANSLKKSSVPYLDLI